MNLIKLHGITCDRFPLVNTLQIFREYTESKSEFYRTVEEFKRMVPSDFRSLLLPSFTSGDPWTPYPVVGYPSFYIETLYYKIEILSKTEPRIRFYIVTSKIILLYERDFKYTFKLPQSSS